jgi:hypothetical protein
VSIIVGSVDASGTPAACRGVGLCWAGDLSTMTVYVPVATSRDTIANVATTKRIAVGTAHPLDHSSVQLKGTATAVRLAGDDELEVIRKQLAVFSDILEHIGLPRRITRRLNHWPAFAIDFTVDESYEQTPGPKAGTRIQ